MIKKGSTTITPKGFAKVMKGSSLVWEKEKLVFEDGPNFLFDYLAEKLRPNRSYRFITDRPQDSYTIDINYSGAKKIKNKDVFKCSRIANIEIENKDLNEFTIQIYETTSKPNIIA